jgi:aminoglycoside phosphotransferase (APT) family kinase protein
MRRARCLRGAETIQHDDLHHANLYVHDGRMRVLDWGDASISHPFSSLVVTFRFLEERTKLAPGDPLFARLRDGYLEPWSRSHRRVYARHTRRHLRTPDRVHAAAGRTAAGTASIRHGLLDRATARDRPDAQLTPAHLTKFDPLNGRSVLSLVLWRPFSQPLESLSP